MGPSRQKLKTFSCHYGHAFFECSDACPHCGAPLATMLTPSQARLVVHTTVRIIPAGKALTLGVAETKTGARTLCIVRGRIRGNGRDRVVLHKKGDLYYALGRMHRTAGDSSEQISSSI